MIVDICVHHHPIDDLAKSFRGCKANLETQLLDNLERKSLIRFLVRGALGFLNKICVEKIQLEPIREPSLTCVVAYDLAGVWTGSEQTRPDVNISDLTTRATFSLGRISKTNSATIEERLPNGKRTGTSGRFAEVQAC